MSVGFYTLGFRVKVMNSPILLGLIPRDLGSSPVDIHEAKQVVKLLLRERGTHPPVDVRNAEVRHSCAGTRNNGASVVRCTECE